MYYGSNRATAIAFSTMLLALLLASSFTSIPIVHGAGASISPSGYPLFCDSTGNLTVTFNTGGQTWWGVAIEIPKEFGGLVSGEESNIHAPGITYDEHIGVYDEELYYPYDQEYFWVQIAADPARSPDWPAITGTQTVTISDLTAPSIAGDYTINLYYTTTTFPWRTKPYSLVDGNRGNALPSVTVKVHMREEASTISGYVRDTSYATGGELTSGYVTATTVEVEGLPEGQVVAKTTIASNGAYTLTGLYEGTYKLTAWGKLTKVSTVFAYIPTELPQSVTVGRKATLTGVNIAATKGGEISGYVRLYDGVTPISPTTVFGSSFGVGNEASFLSPNAYLPVRLELVDSEGTVLAHTTVNVPGSATLVSYSLKEVTTPYEYGGIPAGTYSLKAYAFGFVQSTPVSVSVTAPGGVTIDVPLKKGGGIQGTLYYLTAQGITYTLASDTNILLEAFDSTGAVKGVWIGTAHAGQTQTSFMIRGTGEDILPVATAGHSTVALKTYSGRGVKDSGLVDGGYTITVNIRGFIQPTPYPTAVISYAAMGAVSIYLKQGGTVTGTIRAKDPTGVYAENWQRAAVPAWEYDQTGTPKTRIRAYIYDATDASLGYTTVYQDSATQTASFSFTGDSEPLGDLQCGDVQTALGDGTYTVKVYSWGYWQPTPYPTATIYSGGTVNVECDLRRGGSVAGTITFREAGILIPGGISGLLKVEALDAAGAVKGVELIRIPSGSPVTQKSYSIYGTYKWGIARDSGIVDGSYTVRLTLKGFSHPTQTVTVAGGSSATSNFDAYRMGSVTGTVRGAVTYQATPIRMSWVTITLAASPVQYTTYSAEGTYSLSVPDGTYTMTFAALGYEPYTVTVSISSGATQVISADLVESFEPIPEFPLGAVFTLVASLGLALYLLRWTRKPITPKI